MSLGAVVKGKIKAPYRLTVHGPDGVGKTTFAASAPNSIILGPEIAGSEHLDVHRFPLPDGGLTWEDAREAVFVLTNDPHEYKTLVVDSLDHLEPLLFNALCRREKVNSIEDVGGGFGKGYVAALDAWRYFLADLERLQAKRGMNVVLLAHSFIKNFKNPEGDDFDRYILKLHEKSAALIREWSHGVYFATYETFAVREKKDRAETAKGVGGSNRVLYTQRRAAYDAKDRYGLPTKLPLNWDEFDKLATAGSDPVAIKADIEKLLAGFDGEIRKTGTEYAAKAGADPRKLAQVKDWLIGKVNEKDEKAQKEAA
jgi:hypothetical protein